MEVLIYVAIAFIHPSKLDEGHVCDLERSGNEKLKRLKARLSRGKVEPKFTQENEVTKFTLSKGWSSENK